MYYPRLMAPGSDENLGRMKTFLQPSASTILSTCRSEFHALFESVTCISNWKEMGWRVHVGCRQVRVSISLSTLSPLTLPE